MLLPDTKNAASFSALAFALLMFSFYLTETDKLNELI